VVLGVPLFFVAGAATPGVQGGVALHWDASRHFGLFADVTAAFFPGVDADLRPFWIVPAAGIQGRL
jgi:hypothetical protein